MSIEKTSSQRPGGVTSSVRQPSATSQVSAWLKQHKLGQIYVQESFGHTTYYLQGEGKVSVREEYLHLNLAWLAKKVEGGWENAVGANLNQRYYLGVFGNNIGPTVSSCTDQRSGTPRLVLNIPGGHVVILYSEGGKYLDPKTVRGLQ